jgi:hypothetical protein
MVAKSLGTEHARQYSVVGQNASATGDVEHVGILSDDDHLNPGKEVYVFDMAPPLRFGPPMGKMIAHAVGYLDPLEPDERNKIKLWLSELQTLGAKPGYHVLPATRSTPDPGTGRPQYRSFSCAGFVATCYKEGVGVSLIVDEPLLPEVERTLTEQIWERAHLHLPRERRNPLLQRLGLLGPGPWRVLLPAYLLHALNRARSELPYGPCPTDWKFP